MVKTKNEIDTFTQQVIKFGDSVGITIPKIHQDFSGVKVGDMIKVSYVVIKKGDEKNGGRKKR
jgi:hypothetical protein